MRQKAIGQGIRTILYYSISCCSLSFFPVSGVPGVLVLYVLPEFAELYERPHSYSAKSLMRKMH